MKQSTLANKIEDFGKDRTVLIRDVNGNTWEIASVGLDSGMGLVVIQAGNPVTEAEPPQAAVDDPDARPMAI